MIARFLARTCALALLLLAGPPALAETVVPTERVKRSVVVRQDPIGAPSIPIGALKPGDTAELIESIPYYFKIRLSNGAIGYVSKSWTETAESEALLAAAAGRPLELHFIDVGQGDSTLILCPNGRTILADGGSLSGRDPDEVRQYLLSKIQTRGSDIDYLIVSHPDADHYNLLRDVLEDVPIGRSWYVGTRDDYRDPTIHDWLRTRPEASTQLVPTDYDRESVSNSQIDCGAAKVWVLAAAIEHPESPVNARSIVFMIRYGDFEAVITGDATHATEGVILKRYSPTFLDIDVLRVGHHGSLVTSTSRDWAEKLSPVAAIFSAGYSNNYGHPRHEVVDRLTPYTATVAAHPFRDWAKNEGAGNRAVATDFPAMTEAIYTTAMNRTIVIRTSGSGFDTLLNQ